MDDFKVGDKVILINHSTLYNGDLLEIIGSPIVDGRYPCKLLIPNPNNSAYLPGQRLFWSPELLRVSRKKPSNNPICQCEVFNYGCTCARLAWEQNAKLCEACDAHDLQSYMLSQEGCWICEACGYATG